MVERSLDMGKAGSSILPGRTMKLVHKAENEIDASMIKNYLESEGVTGVVMKTDTSEFHGRYSGTAPYMQRHEIFVPDDQETKARELIEKFEK